MIWKWFARLLYLQLVLSPLLNSKVKTYQTIALLFFLFLPLLSAFHPSHFKGRWNDKWLPNWGYWQKADIWHYTQFVTVMTNQPGGNGFWYKKQSILVILVWHFKKLGQDSSRLEYKSQNWKKNKDITTSCRFLPISSLCSFASKYVNNMFYNVVILEL